MKFVIETIGGYTSSDSDIKPGNHYSGGVEISRIEDNDEKGNPAILVELQGVGYCHLSFEEAKLMASVLSALVKDKPDINIC